MEKVVRKVQKPSGRNSPSSFLHGELLSTSTQGKEPPALKSWPVGAMGTGKGREELC